MTQEGQGQRPEEPFVPPASTRWSEDAVDDDIGVAPPFVPGRSTDEGRGEDAGTAREPAAPTPERADRPAAEPDTEAGVPAPPFAPAGDGSDHEAWPEEDEVAPFPFETGDQEPAPSATEAGGEEGPARDTEDHGGWSPGDLYGEEPDAGDAGFGAGEEEFGAGEAGFMDEEEAAPDWGGEAEPAEPGLGPQRVDYDAAFGGAEESTYGWSRDEAMPIEDVEAEAAPPPVDDDLEEIAATLDRLARMLREDGPAAVEAEMRSRDRLTSLLAGMVSGFLTGRS